MSGPQPVAWVQENPKSSMGIAAVFIGILIVTIIIMSIVWAFSDKKDEEEDVSKDEEVNDEEEDKPSKEDKPVKEDKPSAPASTTNPATRKYVACPTKPQGASCEWQRFEDTVGGDCMANDTSACNRSKAEAECAQFGVWQMLDFNKNPYTCRPGIVTQTPPVTPPATAPSGGAERCGPEFGNAKCPSGKCCSQFGYCDTSPAHCCTNNLASFNGDNAPTSQCSVPSTQSGPAFGEEGGYCKAAGDAKVECKRGLTCFPRTSAGGKCYKNKDAPTGSVCLAVGSNRIECASGNVCWPRTSDGGKCYKNPAPLGSGCVTNNKIKCESGRCSIRDGYTVGVCQ